MADVTVEQLADEIYKLLVEYHGKKRFKTGDIVKEMKSKNGAEKKDVKKALKILMDDGRTIYGYAGGSWIEPVVKED